MVLNPDYARPRTQIIALSNEHGDSSTIAVESRYAVPGRVKLRGGAAVAAGVEYPDLATFLAEWFAIIV